MMEMMIKRILFSFLFLISITQLFAQEQLVPLQVNPTLIEQHGFTNKNQSAKTQQTFNYTYFLSDTLNLPFIDDFSYNYLAWYNKDYFPASSVSQTTYYSNLFNGLTFPDTLRGNPSQAFYFSFNNSTHQIDTFPRPANGTLQTFSFPGYGYPFTTPDSTFTIWPSYYAPNNVDSVLGILDSILVENKYWVDTFIVDVVKMGALRGKWLDSDVFINDDFAINPITVGVATFDGLDSAGMPYNINVPASYGVADYLTSKPINLLGKVAADSVYLSFHIQQGGNGNLPQVNDSIVVEFYAPTQKKWNFVWKKTSSYPAVDNSWYFVSLTVTDTSYFKQGFMFRFKNYATLSGTFDHWNIDYVKMDKQRTYNNNSYDDVAFVNKQEPALQGQTATTYIQYLTGMLKTSFTNQIVNLNKTTDKNTAYHNNVYDNYGTLLYTSITSVSNMYANTINGCPNLPPPINTPACDGMIHPPFTYQFPDSDICKYYKIQQVISTNPDDIKSNDTISFIQHISNYISYDDGTAEAGYGLNTQYGKIAYKFNLTSAEVLTAVRFYFTPMLNDVTTKEFNITIWDEVSGKPGNIIYQKTDFVSPLYGYSQNNFREYTIEAQTLPAGVFYVGWQQETADKLYLGFDVNTNASSNMFYNVLGPWEGSIYAGSWMIRPVFGSCPFETIGIKENIPSAEILSVYPNPAQNQFFIHSKNDETNEKIDLQVFDITGKSILHTLTIKNEAIDVSNFAKGIYLVKLKIENSTKYYTQKLIIE